MSNTQGAKDFQYLIEKFVQNNALQTIENSNVSDNGKKGSRSVVLFTQNEITRAIRVFNEDIDHEDDNFSKRLSFLTSYGARKEVGEIMYRDNSDKFTTNQITCQYSHGYSNKIILDINITQIVKMYNDTSGVIAHPIKINSAKWGLHMQFRKQNNSLFYCEYIVDNDVVFELEL